MNELKNREREITKDDNKKGNREKKKEIAKEINSKLITGKISE
jgi:hypothetical protein